MSKNNPFGHMKVAGFHTVAVHAPANGVKRIIKWHWGKTAMQRNFRCWPLS